MNTNNTWDDNDILNNIKHFFNLYSEIAYEQYHNVIGNNKYQKHLVNNIYDDISNDLFSRKLLKVSVAILTANYFENEVLNYNIYNDFYKNKHEKILKHADGLNILGSKDYRITEAYILNINGIYVLHLHSPETGSNTPCGSSDLVRYINNNPFINPSWIISFGICYGINPKNIQLEPLS